MSNVDVKTDKANALSRNNQMFQVFTPIGYQSGRLHVILTPQIGFLRGSYTRHGYQDMSYKGTIEKRIVAMMNEARYSVNVGEYEIAPAVAFNAVAYNQRADEDAKAYALTMHSNNQVSVEAGLGLYANRQIGNTKFSAGLMMYREFADPYTVKMSMNGMDGTFKLSDERSLYRAVASFGFDYDAGLFNMYGQVQHFIEDEHNTKVKAGLKYTF